MEPMVPGARSFLKTSPPFITNFTRSVSLILASGSPETATMSANLPFVIDPTSFCHLISFAALMVPACRAAAGVMPPMSTSAVNSRALLPSRHAAPWDPLPKTVTIPLVAMHMRTFFLKMGTIPYLPPVFLASASSMDGWTYSRMVGL